MSVLHAAMLDALPANVALLGPTGTILAVNESWRRFAQANDCRDPAFGVGRNYLEVCDQAVGDGAEAARLVARRIRDVLTGQQEKFALEYSCHAPDEQRWFRLVVTRLPEGQRAGAVVMHVDITDRKLAEEDLRKLSMAVEQSPLSIVITDTGGCIEYVNPFTTAALGYTAEEVIGQNPRIWKGPDTPAEVHQDLWRTITAGRTWEGIIQNRKKNGQPIWEHARIAPLRDPDGGISHYVAVKEDITERRRAEQELRAARAHLEHVTASSAAVIYVLRHDGEHLTPTWVSSSLQRVMGYEVEEALAPGWWLDRVMPEDREQVRASERRLLEQGRVSQEYRFRHGDGSYRWILDECSRLPGTGTGPAEMVGSWLDVTERKKMELQLHHAQKMEAVGRLTGGIAHDFNNILMAILGYTDFLLDGLRSSPRLAEDVREIRKAADRAATLTRQLLAFSRKQVLTPRPINLNQVIADLEKLLRRLLGDDIQLRTVLDPGIGTVHADPGQVEQVVMNLALNARDAMPDGGPLEIRTTQAELDASYVRGRPYVIPGAYAAIWVTDRGTGIPRDVLPHLFEPYFTTKDPGKGTGLGLATVFGIVKQSGGHIEVYSEVGLGSTFKVYLPVISENAVPTEPLPAQEVDGGHETILVVDDDAAIAGLVERILMERGYRVLLAHGVAEALVLARDHAGPIELVLTDVVMPEQGGKELVAALAGLRPELKVIYMSGFTGDAIAQRGLIGTGVPILAKPVAAGTLLRVVREILDDTYRAGV